MAPRSKRGLILARWGTWFFVVAAVAVFLLAVAAIHTAIFVRVAAMGPGSVAIVVTGVVVALGWQARRGLRSLCAFLDLRHFAARPPYWLACVAGAMVSLLVARNVDAISTLYDFSEDGQAQAEFWAHGLGCGLLIFVVLFLVLAFVAPSAGVWFRRDDTKPSKKDKAESATAWPASERLFAWVKDDQPIDSAERDLFGHQEIARRIVDRLTSAAPGKSSDDMSQAVVGSLGSGKTSILRLVCRELASRRRSDIEVIEIQMWPYETARAAVVGIIDRLVEALGEHVNVVGLRGVSGAYAEAISSAPGGSVVLAALRSRPEDPTSALAAMDDIARVIGIQYVVWIEDLERFATADSSDEKLGLVRALLHGLHRLPSFTVITATTDLSHRLDLDKIARYVERLPPLRPDDVQEVCGRFLSRWREQAAERKCIVVDPPIDWPGTEQAHQYLRALVGHRPHDLPSAVELLLTTPRALKQSLRRCGEAWQLLAGEIDLDEMLAMCIVRESLPRAYAVIEDHLDRLREVYRRTSEPAPLLALNDALQKELTAEPAAIVEAVKVLAKELFVGEGRRRLQGLVICRDHVDYWQRFSSVPRLAERARDQRVLQAILAGTPEDGLDALDEDYGAAAVVHLAPRLPWKRLVPLLVPLVRRRVAALRKRHDDGVTHAEPPRGLVSLWNALRKHRWRDAAVDELVDPLGEAIDVCTQEYGLTVLQDLEDLFFTDRDPNIAEDATLLSAPQNAVLQQRARDGIGVGVRDPGRLVEALRLAERWTLRNCLWGIGASRSGQHLDPVRQPFAAWPTTAAIVLDALDIAPDTMVSQVAPLVFAPVDRYGELWRFEPSLCASRFGDVDRVVNAIERDTRSSPDMLALRSALDVWRANGARVSPTVAAPSALGDRGSADAAEQAEMIGGAAEPQD